MVALESSSVVRKVVGSWACGPVGPYECSGIRIQVGGAKVRGPMGAWTRMSAAALRIKFGGPEVRWLVKKSLRLFCYGVF